jgi:hypothetical protein
VKAPVVELNNSGMVTTAAASVAEDYDDYEPPVEQVEPIPAHPDDTIEIQANEQEGVEDIDESDKHVEASESIEEQPCGDIEPSNESSEDAFEASTSSELEVSPVGGELLRLLAQESTLISEELKLRDSKSQLLQTISMLLEKQTQLCEKELYDEAESVDAEITEKRVELFGLNKVLGADIPRQLLEVRERIQELQDHVVFTTQLRVSGEKLRITKSREERIEKLEKLKSKLKIFRQVDEKFNQQQNDLEQRRSELRERKIEIEIAIDEESINAASEKAEAEERYTQLDELVNELQRQLAEAMEQRSECAKIISASDLKLNSVRVKFGERLEEQAKQEEELENNSFELREQKLVEGGGDACVLESEIVELEQLEDSSGPLDELEIEFQDYSSLRGVVSGWAQRVGEIESSVLALRTQLVEAGEYTQLVFDQLASAEFAVKSFKSDALAKRAKLPDLEAEKKEAIANRDFKGAKELALEIAEISAEVETAAARLEALKQSVKPARADLATARQLEESVTAQLEQAEEKMINSLKDLASEQMGVVEQAIADVKTPAVVEGLEKLLEIIKVYVG